LIQELQHVLERIAAAMDAVEFAELAADQLLHVSMEFVRHVLLEPHNQSGVEASILLSIHVQIWQYVEIARKRKLAHQMAVGQPFLVLLQQKPH
jgi:hypothetical protein